MDRARLSLASAEEMKALPPCSVTLPPQATRNEDTLVFLQADSYCVNHGLLRSGDHAKQDMDLRNRQSARLCHLPPLGQNLIRAHSLSPKFPFGVPPMPTQQVELITHLLNLARPDFFLLVLSSVVPSRTARNESTWDLSNRICDRYFCVKAG